MRRTDLFHLMLLLLALALAYVLPFELVVLSYAILGPAHYLTEISWLHDRSYFLPRKSIGFALVAIVCAAPVAVSLFWFGVVVWCTFVVCAVFAATKTTLQRAVLLTVAGAATVWMYITESPFVLIGVLLPTLVHVLVFTLLFMVLGALRSRSKAQAALVAVYLAGIASILLMPPSARTVIPSLAHISHTYFDDVSLALGDLFRIPDLHLDGRTTGLLSFAYTYHYLNWFIKADVIKWANVPKARLAAIAVVSAASTGIYFYDYALGLMMLTALSLGHVALEFPLNSISIRDLGMTLGRGLRPPAPAAVAAASTPAA